MAENGASSCAPVVQRIDGNAHSDGISGEHGFSGSGQGRPREADGGTVHLGECLLCGRDVERWGWDDLCLECQEEADDDEDAFWQSESWAAGGGR